MNKILSNPYLSLIIRVIVGCVFIYAAIGKIGDPVTFAKEIANYKLMPGFSVNIMAMALPWIELVCGLFILAGIRLKASAAISGLLLVVFIIAVLNAMARGLKINCGCFAHKVDMVGWKKVFEDLGYLLGSVYIFFYPVRKLTLENLIIKSENIEIPLPGTTP